MDQIVLILIFGGYTARKASLPKIGSRPVETT